MPVALIGKARRIWRSGKHLIARDVIVPVSLRFDRSVLDVDARGAVAYQTSVPPAGEAPFMFILKGAMTEL